MNEITTASRPLRVRLARVEEYAALAAFTEAAYAHDYALPDGYRTQIIAVAERAEAHDVWIAEDVESGELLGTVTTPRVGAVMTGIAHDDELDFRFLGVAPTARRRGVGALLVRHVLDLAERRGKRRVVLGTGPEMVGAHALYERLGFAREPEHDQIFERTDGSGTFAVLTYARPVEPSEAVASTLAGE